MTGPPKKKHFLKLPRYGGGRDQFKKFISENLRYPAPAREAGIEGFVMVAYDILDNGSVENQHVVKSLGYGCDEEALRLIGMLQFEKVKNRGVRVRVTTRTRINFVLPRVTFSYSQKKSDTSVNLEVSHPEKSDQTTYQYTITAK